MSWEDLFYMFFLVGAVPFGHVVKICGSPAQKKLIVLLAGVFIIYTTCGIAGGVHSFLTILGTYCIMRVLGSRYGPWTAFVFNFSYLFFFRTCHWYGFAEVASYLYSNAVQLFVTLRMCTVAFEGFQISTQEARHTTKLEYTTGPSLKISLFDIFAYGYNYCGLLTGPHCRFITFVDMLHQKNTTDIRTVKIALERLKYLPLYAVVYIPLNAYFPLEYIGSPAYMNHPSGFLYKYGYLIPTAVWWRWRFHIGWSLAEASCIMMGLGAYPDECKCKPGQGPTVEINISDDTTNRNVEKYNFETIRNINVYEIETTPNMRAFMKNWNMTVQWWLAAYVHRKVPFTNKTLRMTTVLLVSAFWHGVKPGYYVCFMSVPAIVAAELCMERVVQPWSSKRLKNIYDWANWFILYRVHEYLGISFMLLEIAKVWRVWKELYFCMHILVFSIIVVSFFLPTRKVTNETYYGKATVKYYDVIKQNGRKEA